MVPSFQHLKGRGECVRVLSAELQGLSQGLHHQTFPGHSINLPLRVEQVEDAEYGFLWHPSGQESLPPILRQESSPPSYVNRQDLDVDGVVAEESGRIVSSS